MRKIISSLFLLFSIGVLSFNCQTRAIDEKTKPCRFLSFDAAEKILGRRVELISNSWTFTRETTRFDCQYRAFEKDRATGSEINLFFMLEESEEESGARQIYETIFDSNKNHRGIEILSGIGDQAYAHSERGNFHFVMARKGKFTVRLKVNKAVEATSLAELKFFVQKMVGQI